MTTIDIERMESLRKQRDLLVQVIAIKDKVSDRNDKLALDHLARQMAEELSVPYQLDLIEE